MLEPPLLGELGRALTRLATDGDDLDTALFELAQSALKLAQLGSAHRTMQAPEEHDHRERAGSLIGETVGAAAKQRHGQVRRRLCRANAMGSGDLGGGGHRFYSFTAGRG